MEFCNWYNIVVVIGDGVNDVLVLCVVDVGVVIVSGLDVVIEVVDFVFMDLFSFMIDVICLGWFVF